MRFGTFNYELKQGGQVIYLPRIAACPPVFICGKLKAKRVPILQPHKYSSPLLIKRATKPEVPSFSSEPYYSWHDVSYDSFGHSTHRANKKMTKENSRSLIVEQSEETETDDKKTVSSKINIKAEISLRDFIKAVIDFVFSKCKKNSSKLASREGKKKNV